MLNTVRRRPIARLGTCFNPMLVADLGAPGGAMAGHAAITHTHAAASGMDCAADEAGGKQNQGKNYHGFH